MEEWYEPYDPKEVKCEERNCIYPVSSSVLSPCGNVQRTISHLCTVSVTNT